MMRRILLLALPLALGGCISLFPKQEPAQLYSFGSIRPASTSAEAPPPRFVVLNGVIGFDRLASTDRILTVSGNEVAYIKGARWAASAPQLFRSAEFQAFDAGGGPARLIDIGDASHVDDVLKVDVLRFEARYDQGMAAPPTVVVRLNASLNKQSDRSFLGDRVFEAAVPASDNRVGAITAAFDQATSQALGQLVTWVGQTGG